MNDLAVGYVAANQLDLALPLLEQTLALQKAAGPRTSQYAQQHQQPGGVYRRTGQ